MVMWRIGFGSRGSRAGAWLLLVVIGVGACAESQTPKGPAAPPAATASTDAPPSAAIGEAHVVPTLERLLAVRDEQGGAGLLAELKQMPADPEREFALQKQVFDLLKDLNDPGAAEALVSFLQRKPHVYFETRAAQALAALGDLRAVPFLAHRLRLDPLQVYSSELAWEQRLRRDDNERVTSARLLADLVELHPEAQASIAAAAEDAIWSWLTALPSPHANGLRALAGLGPPRNIAELRAWSDPQLPLPVEEQLPPMPEEWIIAQSALRYVGKLRDEPSFPVLLRALARRPPDIDVSMDSVMSGGIALLGMSLRALAVGAADGLSEWGDARAFAPLLNHIEDRMNNEASRQRAGAALGWVGTDGDLEQLARRVARGAPSEPARFQLACFIEGLLARPVPAVAASLLPTLDTRYPVGLRAAAARAIGRNRLDQTTEARLTALLRRAQLKTHAALSLLLGGSTKAVVAAIQSYESQAEPSIAELSEAWYPTFGYFSRDDVANGTLFRYIENADAVAEVRLRGEPQVWARALLGRALQNLVFDNGPHSLTRVVLNEQLRRVARGSDRRLAGLALRAFTLLNEPGNLLDLSRATGPGADAARDAYRELLISNAKSPKPSVYE